MQSIYVFCTRHRKDGLRYILHLAWTLRGRSESDLQQLVSDLNKADGRNTQEVNTSSPEGPSTIETGTVGSKYCKDFLFLRLALGDLLEMNNSESIG